MIFVVSYIFRNVYGTVSGKISSSVKTASEDLKLEINSSPDLYLYMASDRQMPILGVIEVSRQSVDLAL